MAAFGASAIVFRGVAMVKRQRETVMPNSPPNPKIAADGSLQFEVTDFSDARRALDEPPAGLEHARRLRPAAFQHRRRPPLPTDHALAGTTVEWILSLAPTTRPAQLADAIPRIANALAERWGDSQSASDYLNDLLIDRRGGRQGFPPAIKRELVGLHLLLRRNRARQPNV